MASHQVGLKHFMKRTSICRFVELSLVAERDGKASLQPTHDNKLFEMRNYTVIRFVAYSPRSTAYHLCKYRKTTAEMLCTILVPVRGVGIPG